MTRFAKSDSLTHPGQVRRADDRLAICEGKSPLTWAQAKGILDRTPRKGRTITAYHCPVCRAWHVGNPPKVKRPKDTKPDRRTDWDC
jgi:hypothetical protein